jgi:hypothetical protein
LRNDVVQFAELWFAVFTAALFYVLRNGPNGDNTALGPHRLSADNYARLNQFLFLVIVSEVFTSIMLFSFGIKKVGIDPRPYIGEYLGAHSLAGMHLMPLILQLPIVRTYTFNRNEPRANSNSGSSSSTHSHDVRPRVNGLQDRRISNKRQDTEFFF